jgi:hypothetical protein
MKFTLLTTFAVMASAQSHPTWWTYASPRATALVGIQWSYLQTSPFAQEVAGKLNALGVPNLRCLSEAQQILISSPELLIMSFGGCSQAVLRREAQEKGWKASTYRNIGLWVAAGETTLSVAQFSDQLLLIGKIPTLRDTIDRSLQEKDRAYSKLLARAARYAKEDLWIVAARLPDPLADRFMPLELKARSFEGSVSFWDGMHLVAAIEAAGEPAAVALAESLSESVQTQSAFTEGTEISTDGRTVLVSMNLTEPQRAAAIPNAPLPPPIPVAAPAPQSAPAPAPVKAEPVEAAKQEPPKPKVVRIFGLDDTPREIPFEPAKPF